MCLHLVDDQMVTLEGAAPCLHWLTLHDLANYHYDP